VRRTTLRFVTLSLIMSSVGPFLGGSALGEEFKSIWVAHRRVDCIGVVPQKCYLIKSHQYEDWRFWYNEIEGFEFEEGYAYELLVREVRVENPPADAPAAKLELVEILLKVETYEKKDDPQPPPAPAAPAAAELQTVEVTPAPTPPPPAPAIKKVETPPPPAPEPAKPRPTPPAPSSKAVPVPVPSDPAPSTTTPPPAAPRPAPQPRAPKGQEIRGHLSIGAGVEARSFKICGTQESIWVEDRTDGDLWSIYRQMALFPNRPLFMIVRGELQAPPPSGFGAHYSQQLLINDLRHAATESAGCFDDLSRLQFRASGNEPSWTLEISPRGLALTEVSPEGKILFPYAPPTFTDGRVVYQGRTGGNSPRSVLVRLREESCSDTMADGRYSYAATVEIDGRTLEGCALEGGAKP
jgi:uncharacterized membrane protein